MRIASQRREDEFEINLIPLIDVMLTLLMFFVLTTTFVEQARIKITLPQADNSAQAEMRDPLLVLIDRSGNYYVNNNAVTDVSEASLKAMIVSVAGDDRTRPVMLRADAMTPHQAVITAMDALGSLGFSQLSIATTPAGDASKQ